MPIVALKKDDLFKKLGKSYTDEEFDELCFEFGLELDEITSEKEMIAKEQGDDKAAGACEDVIFKIEVPANRYDLLCMEGLTRGLMVFLERVRAPIYHCLKPVTPLRIVAQKSCLQVRPFVVAAVLRNINFTPERYASFIELQDKLHQNICRKRTLTAIGTHDLDTIEAPFVYDAKPPEEIRFQPLGQTKEYTAVELMELYSKESHLKPYLPIIRDSPVYPVIYDKNHVVLSMPPIINGEHSKIRVETKNVFIECTATDLHKATIVLDTLVTMFSEYCETPFTVEAVEVEQADGTQQCYPTLESRRYSVPLKYINSRVGVHVSVDECVRLLERMGLRAFSNPITQAGEEVEVCVPPTRHDILHPCDIMEDVAVAYGFNKIPERRPMAYGTAFDQPLNKLSDLLRAEMAASGFTECLTFSLCSREDISKHLRKTLDTSEVVQIANPKTQEFQVIRTTLLPGILHTMDNNQHLPHPLKLFEIQDVVKKDASKDVGTRNRRHLCAVYCNRTAGFEIMHGILDRIMLLLEMKPGFVQPTDGDNAYQLRPCSDETFLKNQGYTVHAKGTQIGVIGVLHPEIIEAFNLKRPCTYLEIYIEPFL